MTENQKPLTAEEERKLLLAKAIDLPQAFANLDYALLSLKDYLLRQTLPAYFPPHYSIQDPRQFTANQQTDIWYRERNKTDPKPLSKSGIYCVDDYAPALFEEINEHKLVFKASVFKLRDDNGARYSIDNHLRTRSPAFNAALKRQGLAMLDLLACYRPIQLITDTVHSFMFSWARSHKRVVPMKVEEVRAVLEKMPDLVGFDAIANMRHDELIADVRAVSAVGRPNLCANLVFEDSDKERALIHCAYPCLYRADSLPRHISFRDMDEEDDRSPTRERKKTKIGDPISPNSQFHFYL